MAAPGKAARKEKKKPIPVKTSLNSPYDLRWAPLEKGRRALILAALRETIDGLGLKKSQERAKRLRPRRKDTRRGPEPEEPEEAEEAARRPASWSDQAARRQLAIGINEVTKGLEKDELSLVLVCGSARPAHMTSHLIPLSRSRAVPACQVPELSEGLSGLLGLSSVLALGFRRGGAAFASTVGQIRAQVPPLHVAWVPTQEEPVRLGGELPSDEEETEEQSGGGPGETPPNPPRGLKRKLDLSQGPTQDRGPELQPLKVKKTIPNPSKTRKPKKTKAAQK